MVQELDSYSPVSVTDHQWAGHGQYVSVVTILSSVNDPGVDPGF